jgi:hypothetical protein
MNVEYGEPQNEEPEAITSGDMFFRHYKPRNVARDTSVEKMSECKWNIVVDYVNRFELANKYKKKMQAILDVSDDLAQRYSTDWTNVNIDKECDTIPLYTLVHQKSAALPKGRLVECIGDGTVLFDGDMEYKQFPLIPIVPSTLKSIPFGYTIAMDLLTLQKVFDGVYSTIITNQEAFGTQNVLVPENSNISVSKIADGLNFINYISASGKPESLNLLNTPPESYKLLDLINSYIQTISGVNSVARGNPEASLKSGSALALVASMSLQFNSAFQNSNAFFKENSGTALISVLQQYASTPRIALISGKTNRSYLQSFTKDDIANISRVVVDIGNPLQRTIAGRLEMAEVMLSKNMIRTPEEYLQVVDSGRIEPLIENERNELLLIRNENEKLMDGFTPIAMITDNHPLHIKSHAAVTSSVDSRENPQVIEAVTNHITEHIEILRTADPDLMAVLGIQSLMPPPMPPAGDIPMGEAQNMPQMPNMPKNALTGEEFNNQTGGL